ncbi:hypothetical protein N9045_00250 [bacterium]|nr:hypothetical protein [bacterium]
MISPSKIAAIINEDIDDLVNPELDDSMRQNMPQGLESVGRFNPEGMSVLQDTFEEIEIGPYSIHIEADVAYDYQEGEKMVKYYSDGSGYPGSPAELEAYLDGINEINIYIGEDGDEVCSWKKNGESSGDCSVITPDLVDQIEKIVNKMIQNKTEEYIEEVGESLQDDFEADRDRYSPEYYESTNSNHLGLIADSDSELFESVLSKSGLKVIGKRDCDPLRKSVQSESVQSIASLISESKDVNPKVSDIAKLADSLGYIVESSEKVNYRGFNIQHNNYGHPTNQWDWIHPDYYDADLADGGEHFVGNEFAGVAKDVEDAKNQIDDLIDEIGQTDPDYAGENGQRDLENAFPGGPINPGPNYDGREARGGMSGSFHNKAVEEG